MSAKPASMANSAGDAPEEHAIKVSRSISAGNQLMDAVPASEGHYPAVLVMFHPSMREMAGRLVRETTKRIDKLNGNGKVSTYTR